MTLQKSQRNTPCCCFLVPSTPESEDGRITIKTPYVVGLCHSSITEGFYSGNSVHFELIPRFPCGAYTHFFGCGSLECGIDPDVEHSCSSSAQHSCSSNVLSQTLSYEIFINKQTLATELGRHDACVAREVASWPLWWENFCWDIVMGEGCCAARLSFL